MPKYYFHITNGRRFLRRRASTCPTNPPLCTMEDSLPKGRSVWLSRLAGQNSRAGTLRSRTMRAVGSAAVTPARDGSSASYKAQVEATPIGGLPDGFPVRLACNRRMHGASEEGPQTGRPICPILRLVISKALGRAGSAAGLHRRARTFRVYQQFEGEPGLGHVDRTIG
jgi:hypothetical protein